MAGLKIFVVITIALVTKDGAFSCSLRSDKHDSTLQADKSPTSYQSILPSESTSNTTQFSDSVSKAQTTASPYALGSGSSSSLSILLNPPYGSVSSTTSTVLRPQLPTYTHFSPGTKTDLINFLVKISPLVPSPSSFPTSKSTPLSPLCPLFTSKLNKNVNQGTKPCSISHPVKPSSGVLPGVPHDSSSPSTIPVPGLVPVQASEKLPALTPVPFLEHGPEIVPEEFSTVPKLSSVSGSTPVEASTSTLSTLSAYNPDCVNYLLKLLLSYQSQTGSSSSLIPTTTPVSILTSNTIPAPASDIKPHTVSPACVTPSGSSSTCSPIVSPNQSNGSISPLQQMLMSMTPLPVSGISSGYNPEFMKLVIKNLLSNATSSLLPKSSLFPLLQSKLNTTSNFPPTPDTFPTSNFNKSLSELNPNVSSNNTFDLAPGSNTNQNISISNNQILTNILIKLLTSSNSSKTPVLPCSSSSRSYSISALGNTPITSVPCIPPLSSISVVLSKFPSLTPDSKPTFSGLIPSPIVPFTNVKQFPEQVQNVTPAPTLTPSSYPLSPSLDIDPCRLKVKLPIKFSSLTSDAKIPSLKNIIQPHTPHLPSLCSLPSTKLSSGCKLLSPAS